ncbi:MAG: type IV secretion system protein [Rickettsiales bacterium]|nr:type IV secretion system protein [Rickettsiales bacterium]
MSRLKRWIIIAVTCITFIATPTLAMADSLRCGGGAVVPGTELFPTVGSANSPCIGVTNDVDVIAQGIFSWILCNFIRIINPIMGEMYCTLQFAVQDIVAAAFTLYIALYGFQLLMGNVRFTVKEFMARLLKIVFCWIFLTQSSWGIGVAFSFFYNLAIQGTGWVLSGVLVPDDPGGYGFNRGTGFIDNIAYQAVIGPFTQASSKVVGFFAAMSIVLPPVFMMAIYWLWNNFLIAVRAMVSFMLGLSAIGFLITLSPIFLSFMLFKITHEFFESWLNYLVSFVLQIIVIFAIIAMWLAATAYFIQFFNDMAETLFPYRKIETRSANSNINDSWGICPYKFVDDAGSFNKKVRCKERGFDPEENESDHSKLIGLSKLVQQSGLDDTTGGGMLDYLDNGPQEGHGGYIYYLIFNLITLIILTYAFSELLKQAPGIAQQLAGPKYVPTIGEGFGFSQVAGLKGLTLKDKFAGGGAAGLGGLSQLAKTSPMAETFKSNTQGMLDRTGPSSAPAVGAGVAGASSMAAAAATSMGRGISNAAGHASAGLAGAIAKGDATAKASEATTARPGIASGAATAHGAATPHTASSSLYSTNVTGGAQAAATAGAQAAGGANPVATPAAGGGAATATATGPAVQPASTTATRQPILITPGWEGKPQMGVGEAFLLGGADATANAIAGLRPPENPVFVDKNASPLEKLYAESINAGAIPAYMADDLVPSSRAPGPPAFDDPARVAVREANQRKDALMAERAGKVRDPMYREILAKQYGVGANGTKLSGFNIDPKTGKGYAVVTGSINAMDRLEKQLKTQKIEVRRDNFNGQMFVSLSGAPFEQARKAAETQAKAGFDQAYAQQEEQRKTAAIIQAREAAYKAVLDQRMGFATNVVGLTGIALNIDPTKHGSDSATLSGTKASLDTYQKMLQANGLTVQRTGDNKLTVVLDNQKFEAAHQQMKQAEAARVQQQEARIHQQQGRVNNAADAALKEHELYHERSKLYSDSIRNMVGTSILHQDYLRDHGIQMNMSFNQGTQKIDTIMLSGSEANIAAMAAQLNAKGIQTKLTKDKYGGAHLQLQFDEKARHNLPREHERAGLFQERFNWYRQTMGTVVGADILDPNALAANGLKIGFEYADQAGKHAKDTLDTIRIQGDEKKLAVMAAKLAEKGIKATVSKHGANSELNIVMQEEQRNKLKETWQREGLRQERTAWYKDSLKTITGTDVGKYNVDVSLSGQGKDTEDSIYIKGGSEEMWKLSEALSAKGIKHDFATGKVKDKDGNVSSGIRINLDKEGRDILGSLSQSIKDPHALERERASWYRREMATVMGRDVLNADALKKAGIEVSLNIKAAGIGKHAKETTDTISIKGDHEKIKALSEELNKKGIMNVYRGDDKSGVLDITMDKWGREYLAATVRDTKAKEAFEKQAAQLDRERTQWYKQSLETIAGKDIFNHGFTIEVENASQHDLINDVMGLKNDYHVKDTLDTVHVRGTLHEIEAMANDLHRHGIYVTVDAGKEYAIMHAHLNEEGRNHLTSFVNEAKAHSHLEHERIDWYRDSIYLVTGSDMLDPTYLQNAGMTIDINSMNFGGDGDKSRLDMININGTSQEVGDLALEMQLNGMNVQFLDNGDHSQLSFTIDDNMRQELSAARHKVEMAELHSEREAWYHKSLNQMAGSNVFSSEHFEQAGLTFEVEVASQKDKGLTDTLDTITISGHDHVEGYKNLFLQKGFTVHTSHEGEVEQIRVTFDHNERHRLGDLIKSAAHMAPKKEGG